MKNISDILKAKKKVRLLTSAGSLLLLFCLISLFMSKNPRNTEAAMVSNSTSCKLSGGVSYILTAIDKTTCENKDVTVDGNGSTLRLYGQHTFNSLTITNGGQVTHDQLTTSEAADCDSNNNGSIFDLTDPAFNSSDSHYSECQIAVSKEVNITVTENITLQTGGQINVNGKGYPGVVAGEANGCNSVIPPNIHRTSNGKTYGFGPGGGQNYENVDGAGGGGGGFGGDGKLGTYDSTSIGSQSYNYINNNGNYEFGSGGGGGSHAGGGDIANLGGGDGGGRIIINANIINILDNSSGIYANGTDATNKCSDSTSVGGGGGSGGLINIKASFLNYKNGVLFNSVNVGAGKIKGEDGQLLIKDFGDFTTLYQISAQGGAGKWNRQVAGTWSGGGGGIVAIDLPDPKVVIKKTLLPIQRPEGISNTNFNPYALQVGDVIKVNLDITNAYKAINVIDKILKTSDNTHICAYYPALGASPVSLSSTDPIQWTNLSPDADNKITAYYYCKVQ